MYEVPIENNPVYSLASRLKNSQLKEDYVDVSDR